MTAVLDGVSVAADVTGQLPSDTASLYAQLIDTIDDLRREYES